MIGIIGGTGFYKLPKLAGAELRTIQTPFGTPSAPISINDQLAFLPRHGSHHELLPHEINYRANIYALKSLGVTQIISVSSVGSLVENFAPGHFAVPDQYLDFTHGTRASSFFGNGLLAHVPMAEPSCPAMAQILFTAASEQKVQVHRPATLVCINGPRYNTRAESLMARQAGGHLVGMTAVPEVFLCREAQICHAGLAVVTDYDCWKQEPGEQVSHEKVKEQFQAHSVIATRILDSLLATFSSMSRIGCSCRSSLSGAVISHDASLSVSSLSLLRILSA